MLAGEVKKAESTSERMHLYLYMAGVWIVSWLASSGSLRKGRGSNLGGAKVMGTDEICEYQRRKCWQYDCAPMTQNIVEHGVCFAIGLPSNWRMVILTFCSSNSQRFSLPVSFQSSSSVSISEREADV